jgi:hypothetical protein
MGNKNLLENDAFRAVLGPTRDCPSLDELSALISGERLAADNMTNHVRSCAYCRTELHLLQAFLAKQSDSKPEMKAAELLRQRSKHIFQQAFPMPAPTPWWKAAFTVRRLAQASLAMAAVLLVVGAIAFFRAKTYQPEFETRNRTGQEVFRSGSFAVLGPAGDLQETPKEVRWERLPKATSYQVLLLEVDGSEIWKAHTTEDHIELPAAVQVRIVPAKTLLAEITAFDSSGNKVGDTGIVRFRLLRAVKR